MTSTRKRLLNIFNKTTASSKEAQLRRSTRNCIYSNLVQMSTKFHSDRKSPHVTRCQASIIDDRIQTLTTPSSSVEPDALSNKCLKYKRHSPSPGSAYVLIDCLAEPHTSSYILDCQPHGQPLHLHLDFPRKSRKYLKSFNVGAPAHSATRGQIRMPAAATVAQRNDNRHKNRLKPSHNQMERRRHHILTRK